MNFNLGLFLFENNWITNVIAFLVGILFFRKLTNQLKLIFLFVCTGIITESISRIFFIGKNTMPIGHIYIPVSFIVLSVFYVKILQGFVSKRVLIVLIVSFIIFSILNFTFIQKITKFPNILGSISAILILLFSIMLFMKIMVESKIEKLFKEPIIWVNSGVLLYYSANLFFYALFNYSLKHSVEFAKFTVNLFSAFNLIFYLLIAIGFFLTRKSFHRNK